MAYVSSQSGDSVPRLLSALDVASTVLDLVEKRSECCLPAHAYLKVANTFLPSLQAFDYSKVVT